MHVIIIGAGQVGFHLASYLSQDGHDISVIDQSRTLIAQINDQLDVQSFVGQGSLPHILQRAGAKDCDLLIAVTPSDEVNMIACQVAHTHFHIPKKIARVREQSYLSSKWNSLFHPDHIPIDHVISPEMEVADTIYRRVQITGAINSIPLGVARVIGVRCPAGCPIINTPLRQLTSLFPDLLINIMAIKREDRLIIPHSHDQLLTDDIVYFITSESHIARSMSAFGITVQEAKRGIIIGGGHIGINLAQKMLKSDNDFRMSIVEYSVNQAKFAAECLPTISIVNGDALEIEYLKEAGIERAEVAISVTDHDETNIMTGLLSKYLGVPRVVSLVNRGAYDTMIGKLGVDMVINPREITASSILQHIRRGKIEAIHSIFDGAAELMEIEAVENSFLVGKRIIDADLPKESHIGAIIRNEQMLIPRHDTTIEIGDQIILFSLKAAIKKVEKLFSIGVGYL